MKWHLTLLLYITATICTSNLAYSAISCASLLEEPDLYEQMEQTRFNYFREGTRQALLQHLSATSDLLTSDGVKHRLNRQNIQILPTTDSPLNTFAKKTKKLSGAKTFYDPKTLHEDAAQAMMVLDFYADRTQKPLRLLISYEFVATNRVGDADAHEWTHLVQARYLSKRAKQGNIFSSVFRSEEHLVPFDELRTYFTTFSVLLKDFKDELHSPSLFKDEFVTHAGTLKDYIIFYKRFLKDIRKVNLTKASNGWVRQAENHFESQNGELDIVLSSLGENKHIVTLLIYAEGKEVSIPLTTPFTVDLKAFDHTSTKGKATLSQIVRLAETQLKNMSKITQQISSLVTKINKKTLKEDESFFQDFITKYRTLLKPHL